MKQKELELLLSLGQIEKIEVRRAQGGTGWLVVSWPAENVPRRYSPELETARGEAREFSTLDAVFRTLQSAGATKFEVIAS